jgi:hypothetical protein
MGTLQKGGFIGTREMGGFFELSLMFLEHIWCGKF